MKSRIYPRNSCGAFTLIEIAISLGVVAFALVAILGVLPTGLTVQKDNREDTVINQDGIYLMEALRSGAQGMDELTNFVEAIAITNYNIASGLPSGSQQFIRSIDTLAGSRDITNALQIITLLSKPQFELLKPGDTTPVSNSITARIRAITGPATEKFADNDFTFRYQLSVEITPLMAAPTNYVLSLATNDQKEFKMLTNNLFNVRLTFRWPLYERAGSYAVGRYRKTFRTVVGGNLSTYGGFPELTSGLNIGSLYRFQPNTYNALAL